ncbi:nucleoside deaminase [Daejeonella sp.]|uniref:nucleoside deaminase n=1 Tax=Daejeonella sp. TaxID=2805397 RepID=UPI0030BD0986
MQNIDHEKFMRVAIQLSEQNVTKAWGGPFGAVVVKDGKVIAKSGNKVTTTLDPTAHAEVSAIRMACKKLKTFDLSGCVIYTSCEPCPMCLSAIYWARIGKIYFANTKKDAHHIGFDDQFIYDEIALPMSDRKLVIQQILRDEAQTAFLLWDESDMKIKY